MNKAGKVWGETAVVEHRHGVQVHVIKVKAEHFCSKHRHRYRFNRFYVISGFLDVLVWKDYGLVDVTRLDPGDSMVVLPGEWHRFECVTKDCVALEVYWTEAGCEDIEREDHGGRIGGAS